MKKTIVFLITVAVALPVLAGTVIEVEQRTPETGEVSKGTILLEGNSIRMDVQHPGHKNGVMSLLFQRQSRVLQSVDHVGRSYMTFDEFALGQMELTVKDMFKQMDTRLAELPESQKGMLKNMMSRTMPKGGAAMAVEIVPTKDEGITLGLETVRHEIIGSSGEKVNEVWLTDWKNVEATANDLSLFCDLAAFEEEMIRRLNNGPSSDTFLSHYSRLREANGFPVMYRYFENGRIMTETAFTASATNFTDAAIFNIPEGYKPQRVPGLPPPDEEE
ncbi:MAG: hypothetical protein KJ626_03295 [Verrucomicrobia bacterium]|nr:hypothetical protein [Verrucomicrobiota bacterium]